MPPMTRPDPDRPRHLSYLPLDALIPATRNPKTHDLPALIAAIRRLGFADAGILDERTGQLVGGHGRAEALAAMRNAGETPPDGVVVDDDAWTVPVQRGWASRDDSEADAMLLALNRIPEAGGWDSRARAELLEDLFTDAPDLAEITGHTREDLDRLLTEIADRTGGDVEAPAEFPAYDDETIATEYTCPRCTYSWSGKPS